MLDNLKDGVLKPDLYDPTLNRAYAELERHYGFVADPAKVRKNGPGGTIDQQLQIAGDEVMNRDIAPNRRLAAEMVFEPMGSGVRVTARDEHHRVLWGYVGCKETLKQIHCLVAVYGTLQDLLSEELQKRALYCPEARDPIATAQSALNDIEETVKWLRESLDVKKVTEGTHTRARSIARIASDANKQLTLEAGSLKGMGPRTPKLR